MSGGIVSEQPNEGQVSPDEVIDLTEAPNSHPQRRASDQMLKQVVESVDKLATTATSLVSEVKTQNTELRKVREQAARDRELLKTSQRVVKNLRVVVWIGVASLLLLIPILTIGGLIMIRSNSTASSTEVTTKIIKECLTPGYACNSRLTEMSLLRDQINVAQIALDRQDDSISAAKAAAEAGSPTAPASLQALEDERAKTEQRIADLTKRFNELLRQPIDGLPQSALPATTTTTIP